MKISNVILILGILALVVYITIVFSAGKFIKDNPEVLKLAML